VPEARRERADAARNRRALLLATEELLSRLTPEQIRWINSLATGRRTASSGSINCLHPHHNDRRPMVVIYLAPS